LQQFGGGVFICYDGNDPQFVLSKKCLILMTRFFKELYLTMFTIGFRFRAPQRFGGGWGPIIDAGKGVLLVCLIAFFILKGIESYIEFHVGTRFSFDSSKWEMAAITLALYLPNYYVLVTRGHGIKFEREFTHLKKSKKVLLLVSCAVLLLATMAFCIYSDSAYQRFFHIVPKSGLE
jgi:hypothetical protein